MVPLDHGARIATCLHVRRVAGAAIEAAVKPQVAKALLSLAGVDFRSPKARAIDFVLELRPLAYAQVPPWWQWTVAIALAITCKRIEAA